MSEFVKGRKGLRLDAPEPGDIVTVKVKRTPRTNRGLGSISIFARDTDEADNPQHYRVTELWKVIAVNGGQAVVESLRGYNQGRREVWPISLHEWFEASDLAEALEPTTPPQQE